MGFGQSIKTVFSKYFVLQGRASRSEYWWWVLFVIIVSVVLNFIDTLLGWKYGTWTMNTGDATTVTDFKPFGVLQSIWALVVLLPGIAVQVRRLHDTDRSGWWWWLNIICCIGGLILLIFYVMPSTPGDNRYGPRSA